MACPALVMSRPTPWIVPQAVRATNIATITQIRVMPRSPLVFICINHIQTSATSALDWVGERVLLDIQHANAFGAALTHRDQLRPCGNVIGVN